MVFKDCTIALKKHQMSPKKRVSLCQWFNRSQTITSLLPVTNENNLYWLYCIESSRVCLARITVWKLVIMWKNWKKHRLLHRVEKWKGFQPLRSDARSFSSQVTRGSKIQLWMRRKDNPSADIKVYLLEVSDVNCYVSIKQLIFVYLQAMERMIYFWH